MKKLILLLTAVLAVFMTGCGPKTDSDPGAADSPTPTPTALAVSTPEPSRAPEETSAPPAESSAVTSESAAPEESMLPAESVSPEAADPLVTPEISVPDRQGRPSDEEVLKAYHLADEAYGWFEICTLSATGDDVITEDDLMYSPVADPRFPSMDALRAYLKSLFSDEIVDRLLPTDGRQYRDFNGRLYVAEGARGSDMTKGGVTLLVEWPENMGGRGCVVEATVDLLDWEDVSSEPEVVGQQVYVFPYQEVGSKWVFTQFESIF